MTTYPISPDVAKQAAADYLTIIQAGMAWELENEIRQTIEAHRGMIPTMFDPLNAHAAFDAGRLDQWRDCDGHRLRKARGQSAALAELLDCPASAVEPHIVPGMIDGPTRRAIVLDVMRNMASDIQGRHVQEAVRRLESRRSA